MSQSSYEAFILKVTREELAPRLTAAQLVKRIAETYNDPNHSFNIAQREIYITQLDRLRADELEPVQVVAGAMGTRDDSRFIDTEEFIFTAQTQLRFWGGSGGKRDGVTWSVAICTVEDQPTVWVEVRNICGELAYLKHATVEAAAISAAEFKKGYR